MTRRLRVGVIGTGALGFHHARLLRGLADRPRFRVWGIRDPERVTGRVPTVALTLAGRKADDLAQHLAERSIYAWSGNMYAVDLIERLGLADQGGVLRLGLVHYNTADEVDRALAALDEVSAK